MTRMSCNVSSVYTPLPHLPSLSPGLCGHRYQPLSPVLPGQPAWRPEAGSYKRVRGLWEGDRKGRTSARHPDIHMRHIVSSMCWYTWNNHGFQHQAACCWKIHALTWFFLDSSDTFHGVWTDGGKNGETYIHVCSFAFCSSFSLWNENDFPDSQQLNRRRRCWFGCCHSCDMIHCTWTARRSYCRWVDGLVNCLPWH